MINPMRQEGKIGGLTSKRGFLQPLKGRKFVCRSCLATVEKNAERCPECGSDVSRVLDDA